MPLRPFLSPGSKAVGLTPCLRDSPASCVSWLLALNNVRTGGGWGVSGKGARRTALRCECCLQHGCVCPRDSRTAPLRSPVTLALGSGNPAASLWLSLPLLISDLPCSLVWLSALLSPLYLIPYPLLRNDKVVSLLDPDCSL